MDQSGLAGYKDLFFETAKENLKTITDSLAVLRSNPGDANALEMVFVTAHSLKGKSKMMGYVQSADMARLIERTFRGIREGGSTPIGLMEAVQEAVTALEGHIISMEKTGAPTDITPAIGKLENLSGMRAQL